jgi:hypothetical protein
MYLRHTQAIDSTRLLDTNHENAAAPLCSTNTQPQTYAHRQTYILAAPAWLTKTDKDRFSLIASAMSLCEQKSVFMKLYLSGSDGISPDMRG